MDTIFIESLRVDALIGVYAHERGAVQPLLFDIRLGYDTRVPAASDDVADAVDYAAVCEWVRAFVAGRRPQLLEALAEALVEELLRLRGVRSVWLRIRKPEAARALGADAVGVEIVRDAR
jgi:dihydroneopterin aldolase